MDEYGREHGYESYIKSISKIYMFIQAEVAVKSYSKNIVNAVGIYVLLTSMCIV